MASHFQSQPVNDPFGDPVIYIDFRFERRALLLDLGEIHPLPPRKILRLTHAFVSHTHMDHFMGFDRILRICLGREQAIEIFGPPGLIDRVGHRLASYTWNLVRNYDTDFTILAHEVDEAGRGRRARFRCRTAFTREEAGSFVAADGVLLDEEAFRVRATPLDHRVPCLAFALEEKQHVNIWKNRLDEMGLPTGPWLRELRAACRRGDPDDTPIRVWWREKGNSREAGRLREKSLALGELRERVVRIVPGQKIGYVVDAVYHPDNARRIVDLVREADVLFMEAAFLQEDADRAARTCHLTAEQAGRLARDAQVKRFVPIHFSARYTGRPDLLEQEAERAFAGGSPHDGG
jgi:ribonuclease Z